jgi:ribosomal-protein-alanine N-acetyltransferase
VDIFADIPAMILLETNDFRLRPWHPGDEDSLVAQANNYKIWLNLRDTFPHPYTWQEAHAWVELANSLPNSLNLAIDINGAACGGAGLLFQADIHRRSAEIGYWLGEAYWNRGIATAAVKMLSAHAFGHYDICRLYAGIFEYNRASMRVLEKAGYTLEAVHRQALTKNGHTRDEYLYTLLA